MPDTALPILTSAQIVDEYLRLLTIPDPDSRYRWVKKRIDATESVVGGNDAEAVVYSRGRLYGEWPDGTAFEGNRYVDRYVICSGLITHMDVWNDSAEWLLVRAGLATL